MNHSAIGYDDGDTLVMDQPIKAKNARPVKPESVREALTRKITYLLAAELIADPSFPRRDRLPKTVPPPFDNHGHFLLLDYKLLLLIIWQVIHEIQSVVKEWSFKHWTLLSISILGTLVYTLIALSSSVPEAWGYAAIIFGVFYVLGRKILSLKPLKPQIAKIRAKALQDLVNNRPFIITDDKAIDGVARKLSRVGDGAFDGSRAPVLTISSYDHPFPGYGRLLYDQTFVCPPQKDHRGNTPDLTHIRETIQAQIRNFVGESGIENVSFGDVVVVHGNSLFMESHLLSTLPNGEKVPPLWCEKRNISYADLNSDRSSQRAYFAVQVLFPQYMTVATFFTRPFLAGNAIGYQVAVSTLGPPTEKVEHILAKLMQYQQSKSRRNLLIPSGPARDEAIELLRSLRLILRSGGPFQNPNLDLAEIKKLAICERDEANEDDIYDEEIEKLARESVLWPGYYTSHTNWRESHSYAFTLDFFGNSEARASVTALYSQISKAILDGLDVLKFDISEYRDKEGRYMINAEKIDQLIMGERVNVLQKEAATNSGEGKKDETGKSSASGKS